MTDEQNPNESFRPKSNSAVLPRPHSVFNEWSAAPRNAPVLPGTVGFSSGQEEMTAPRPVSVETVTRIIKENVAAARSQAAALPAFLQTENTGNRYGASPLYLFGKRAADVVVSSALLLLLFPVLLIIGFCVFFEDRGPVLYYQTRVGRDGKHFRFYKFRSMVRNADALKKELAAHNEAVGPVFKMKNDPRITRCGRILRKTSLDELPQLINVLRGEMTLVGPRPHLPREIEEYHDWHFERQSVEPGLLCLREVLGRSNLSFDQWVAYDLLYIRNRSVRTDLWILLRLIPAVIKADGAY